MLSEKSLTVSACLPDPLPFQPQYPARTRFVPFEPQLNLSTLNYFQAASAEACKIPFS